jgi:hypothetical protein
VNTNGTRMSSEGANFARTTFLSMALESGEYFDGDGLCSYASLSPLLIRSLRVIEVKLQLKRGRPYFGTPQVGWLAPISDLLTPG